MTKHWALGFHLTPRVAHQFGSPMIFRFHLDGSQPLFNLTITTCDILSSGWESRDAVHDRRGEGVNCVGTCGKRSHETLGLQSQSHRQLDGREWGCDCLRVQAPKLNPRTSTIPSSLLWPDGMVEGEPGVRRMENVRQRKDAYVSHHSITLVVAEC